MAENIELTEQTTGGDASTSDKQGVVKELLAFVSDCVMPLMPGMLGAGILKILLTLLVTLGLLDANEVAYQILFGTADAFFYFLPVFLGWSIASKVGGSVPLYMTVGAMLCYPGIVSLMSGTAEGVAYGQFLGMPCSYLFGIVPVIGTTYTSSVVPMLLMTPIMRWAEGMSDRLSPKLVKSFMQPLLFLLICVPCVMLFVGPLGNALGNGLATLFNIMYATMPVVTIMVIAMLMPFITMAGMHYALIPIYVNNLATIGYDVIVAVTMFCSNICQGGAPLGVSLRTKDEKTRSEGLAASVSAAIGGITEPAMYGVNLRLRRPMVAAVIGSGVSGLIAGLSGVRAYEMGGAPSFLSAITFIGEADPYHSLAWGLACGAIGFAVAMAISFVTYRADQDVREQPVADSE